MTGKRDEGTPDYNLGYYDTFDLLITLKNKIIKINGHHGWKTFRCVQNMADTTGDLDSFFARKDKKKKGQTWDKKKKSNKNENAESAQIFGPESIEHDEWGEIQDDLSKSVKTVDRKC